MTSCGASRRLPRTAWLWDWPDWGNGNEERTETWTQDWNREGHVLWWRYTGNPETQGIRYLQLNKEVSLLHITVWEAGCLTPAEGICRRIVPVCSHLGGRCHQCILHKLTTFVSDHWKVLPFPWNRLGESLDIPKGLRHWNPWQELDHVNLMSTICIHSGHHHRSTGSVVYKC